jgi:hypothetical protein
MVLVVLNLNTYIRDFYCGCVLITLSSGLFLMVFNLWFGAGFIFEPHR